MNRQGDSNPTLRQQPIRLLPLGLKTVASHTITYLLMGSLAFHFLHYDQIYGQPGSGLRAINDPLLILGAPLQVFRGILFALVLYPLRTLLFGRRNGWLLMSWLMIALGILGTFAAPAGSFEGFIYTTEPALHQMRGYLELVPQALLFSALLCYWTNHPEKRWLNWTIGALYLVAVGVPVLGLFAPHHP